eukprot:489118_1
MSRSSLQKSYLIKEANASLLNEDLCEWLIAGYAKDYGTNLPLDVNTTIKIYFGRLWKEKIIHFDRRKRMEHDEFVSDSRIKTKVGGWFTALTNQIIDPKISKKWKVKYKIRSKTIECFIGYSLQNGIKDYDMRIEYFDNNDQRLGTAGSKTTSTGIWVSSWEYHYCLYDSQHCGTNLKYPNQSEAKQNDEYEILYDLENNKMFITHNHSHNDENSVEIAIVPHHKGERLIPAVSLYDIGDDIEILSLMFE